MDPSSYVPNNPQFGVQLECNWSTSLSSLPLANSSTSLPVLPLAAAANSANINGASHTTNNHINNPHSIITTIAATNNTNSVTSNSSIIIPQDELTSCWAEDMGSFSLPLDLEPLPSLFPFSPCSANSNPYKTDIGLNNHNQQMFSLRENKQPAEVADVLLSLKHAVVHPSSGSSHQDTMNSSKCENQHLYHPHHQVLLSPGGYGSNNLCEQNFNSQPLFPAMSVNVSMNMTMHGYHPASSYPSTELTYPQVQWNPSQQTGMPINYQSQGGLLSPSYSGPTYSFTADFRPSHSHGQSEAGCPSAMLPNNVGGRPHRKQQHAQNANGGNSGGSGGGGSMYASEMSDLGGGMQKPNVCRICGKSYARPSTLKTHMRTHSGEKPYRCIDCNKSFSQAANLTAHVRTHSGEKPFRCPVCDRRFSQSSSVTTHMRTHSGERPYRCRLCKKAFSDSSTLTKHLRIHSGEKPYECKLCLLRFSQSGNLNRHMRVHGNNNMIPP